MDKRTIYLLNSCYYDGEDFDIRPIAAYFDFERPAKMCIRLNRKDITGETLRYKKLHQFYYGGGFPTWYELTTVRLRDG